MRLVVAVSATSAAPPPQELLRLATCRDGMFGGAGRLVGAHRVRGSPLFADLSSSVPVLLHVRGLGTIHCHRYAAGVGGGVIGCSSKPNSRARRRSCFSRR